MNETSNQTLIFINKKLVNKKPTSNENKDITNGLVSNPARHYILYNGVHMLLAWNIYMYLWKKEMILEARFLKYLIYILVYINYIQAFWLLFFFIFEVSDASSILIVSGFLLFGFAERPVYIVICYEVLCHLAAVERKQLCFT